MSETLVGRVAHVWPRAHAAAVDLNATLRVGDRVRIRGHGHDFVQEVKSLQIDHVDHMVVGPKDAAALRIEGPVHAGDEVFRIDPEHGWSIASGGY